MDKPKRRLNLRPANAARVDPSAPAAWPILVVDDDPSAHAMTQVLLRDFSFQGRRFEIIAAHSAAEARAILERRADIPVMLLDVVMETEDAGLELARHVREKLGNLRLRIILRTGQPGEAPEHEVMLAYDINDYRAKTELTAQKMFTAVVGALRSFIHIDTIVKLNATLESRVEDRTRELAEARRFAEALVETMPNPVWFKDPQGHYRLYNRAFRDFFRIGEDHWLGRPAGEAWDEIVLEQDLASDAELLAGKAETLSFEAAISLEKSGPRTLIVNKSAVRSKEGTTIGIVGTGTDITERKALERELRRLATTDPLTGIHNRRHFLAAAAQEMERTARYGNALSVIMLDIDHFKRINDRYGHAIGDDVLKRVAEECAASLRDIDIFGRIGGEEFAGLLPETGIEGAREVAERLRKAAAAIRVPVGAADLAVTVSIGVSERGPGETQFLHVLGRADRALYQAKDGGRDRVVTLDATG